MKPLLVLLLLALYARCDYVSSTATNSHGFPVQYWDLATGAHIAYIHVPSPDSAHATPLIFLHGGPGACQVNSFGKEAPEAWYKQVAGRGFDIYIYDQVGSGLSARLNDPAQYTVERHIKDLECIRQLAGNRPCILIGDSWGATLASHYIAAYPRNVVKAIFTSPGSIDIREWNEEYSAVPRFLSGWYPWIRQTYGQKGMDRYIQLDQLMQTDPHKAYAFAGDKEMDKLADDFISEVIFKTCVYDQRFTKSPEFRMQGMGWWSSTMTIWNLMNIPPVRDSLRKDSLPVLIIRGDADYLQPGIAEEYHSVFTNSRFVKVPKAGHFIWLDQPEVYKTEIEKFLFSNKSTDID
jgi:proline-specific peptidase